MDTSIDELRLERLSLRYPRDRARLADFLARHHLKLEEDVQSAFVLLDGSESLAACGCAAGSVLKCFAVEPSLRGQNALGRLVSALVQDRFARGIYDLFIITRAENEALFQNCGFCPGTEAAGGRGEAGRRHCHELQPLYPGPPGAG